MPQPDFKTLPSVLEAVETKALKGTLFVKSQNHKASLFFEAGKIIHAEMNYGEDKSTGDLVLYTLLNWKEGELAWESNYSAPQRTIDMQQSADFFQAVEDLTAMGLFNRQPASASALAAFFNHSKESPVANTSNPAPTTISLPLPPGKPFTLPATAQSFNELLGQLSTLNFTGCLSLKDEAFQQQKRAFLTLDNGQAIAVLLQIDNQEWSGTEALHQLLRQPLFPLREGLIVSPEILWAYSALLGRFSPYQDLKASLNTFKGAVKAFERGNHSGLIRLRFEHIEMFDLIYRGQELGTFITDGDGKALRPVSGGLTMLLENPLARLDIFITRKESTQTSSAFNSSEISVLAGTLAATLSLVSEIIGPQVAVRRLRETTASLTAYPFMTKLYNLDISEESSGQLADFSYWLQNVHDTPRAEMKRAFEELFELYLQPTCLQIGPAIFHEMVVRALGPEISTGLQKLGLRVDFFDRPPESEPGSFRIGTADLHEQSRDENPYDF